ncbi:MAG: hypothetical protein CVU28_08290 [Betaproteobacteria bacterium HGW-Betaproteobacteria-21]|nr:MAG: hypothetical protein CVU28_08290 [Betaproteobacteria bacterium HGW-Betaproteobacteria-21]
MVRESFGAHGLGVPPKLTLSRSTFAVLTRVAAILAPAKYRKALATLPIYLDYLSDNQGFDNTRFRQWMPKPQSDDAGTKQFLPTVFARYLNLRHPV